MTDITIPRMTKEQSKEMFKKCDFDGNYKLYKHIKSLLEREEYVCIAYGNTFITNIGTIYHNNGYSHSPNIKVYHTGIIIINNIDINYIKTIKDIDSLRKFFNIISQNNIIRNKFYSEKLQAMKQEIDELRHTKRVKKNF